MGKRLFLSRIISVVGMVVLGVAAVADAMDNTPAEGGLQDVVFRLSQLWLFGWFAYMLGVTSGKSGPE
jgi:hypothetical protein